MSRVSGVRVEMEDLLLHVTDDRVTILFLILAARDVNPEVKVVAGLDDGLVKVRVDGQELKPATLPYFEKKGLNY